MHFFFPATGDRVPCVFIENHRVVGLDPNDPIRVSYSHKVGNEPLGREHPELLTLKLKPHRGHDDTIINGISRYGYMSGGKTARWKDEEIADTLTQKAVAFIERSQASRSFYTLPRTISMSRACRIRATAAPAAAECAAT